MARIHKNLVKPTGLLIPRVVDQLSFLYLEMVRVEKDDNGVAAVHFHAPTSTEERTYLPTASIAAVLLGPGTTITQQALAQLGKDRCTTAVVGAGAVRYYGALSADSTTTRWLELQAASWADTARRTDIARSMYAIRFGDSIDTTQMTIAQLRGLEGQRIKKLYQSLAKQHGIRFRRADYDPAHHDDADPTNQALTSANQALYAIVQAVSATLGLHPGLGFIHSGTQRAFIYDIADLYKHELTIPLAFSHHSTLNPDRPIRYQLRENLRTLKLVPRIVHDIQHLLAPGETPHPSDPEHRTETVQLWDPELGDIRGGHNYDPNP